MKLYYTSEMHNDLYFTNYLIICYDKETDKVIITTQKCGQSFITRHIPSTHLEVLREEKEGSVKLGSYNLHPFVEADKPLSEILEQSKCTNLDELFSKDVHFVIREPIKRFIANCGAGMIEIFLNTFANLEENSFCSIGTGETKFTGPDILSFSKQKT